MFLSKLRFRFINRVIPKFKNQIKCLSECGSSDDSNNCDIVVVGGGIIGISTAREVLIKNPELEITIVEKECELGLHQTKNNSGVVHAGIYYTPGSLKAKLCGEGLRLMYKYCEEKKIPYNKCGKLIVATSPIEVERLGVLIDRGKKNNVPDMSVLDSKGIKKVEPHCKGLKAIWSPHTGIVNFRQVALSYAEDFKCAGGDIKTKFEVVQFKENSDPEYPITVVSKTGETINSRYVFTCAGLYSDKVAVLSKCAKDPQIIPFRGEYLVLNCNKRHLVKGNIYPVPDPRFPFLGVHFTPTMDGEIILGPNAVLAFKREGYKWGDVDMKEFIETLTYPGFRKMALKYVVPGTQEILKSFITPLQIKVLQRYIPEITAKDVTRGLAGVRAQAMSLDGALVDDFVFSRGEGSIGERVLHCRNAPSPAATSSLAIAKMLCDKVQTEFNL